MIKRTLLWICLGLYAWADAHMFVYHRFGDDRYPSTNTTIEELKREFDYFKNEGYIVIPLDTLIKALRDGKPIDDKWIVLTIDDNFKSFYENGLALFKEYGYPFSLFVYVEATQKRYPDYLTWEQLREISQYGTIEFHSYGHGHMTQMSDKALKEDFDKGLKLMKEKLGLEPKYFTYPYGEYSKRVQKIAKSYGFEAIINQNMGAVSENSDIHDIARTALVGQSNLKLYLRYKALKAEWQEPKSYPKDGVLKSVRAKTDETSTNGGVYITGHGWMNTSLQDGDFDIELNKKLTNKRSRIVLSVGNKIDTKLIIKDTYASQ